MVDDVGTMRDQGRQWAEVGEAELVAALRSGDESAFEYVVDADSAWLLRLARQYVSTDAVAMEVVGDTGSRSSRASTASRAGRRCERGSHGS